MDPFLLFYSVVSTEPYLFTFGEGDQAKGQDKRRWGIEWNVAVIFFQVERVDVQDGVRSLRELLLGYWSDWFVELSLEFYLTIQIHCI